MGIECKFGREDMPPNDWRRVSMLRIGALRDGKPKPAERGPSECMVRGRASVTAIRLRVIIASPGRGGSDFSRNNKGGAMLGGNWGTGGTESLATCACISGSDAVGCTFLIPKGLSLDGVSSWRCTS